MVALGGGEEKINNKDNLQNSSVYLLTWNDCGTTYTGQTGSSFEKKKSVKEILFNFNSKFSQYILENGHSFWKTDDIMNTVYYDKNGCQLDDVEKVYIYIETTRRNQTMHTLLRATKYLRLY